VLAVATAAPLRAGEQGGGPAMTLAAAMSLRHVMPALTDAFRAHEHGPPVHISYAASGDLRKQVEGGAPIDAVVFADAISVDRLIASGHAAPDTRRIVATNTLILIGPRGGAGLTFATIDALPADEMLAIGEPGAVPAGRYARDALQRLGKWEALRGRIVYGGHVGAVLSYVRRGEVAAAIVYGTEIRGVGEVVLLDRADGAWAPRPEIVAAVVVTSAHGARARAFLDFLRSDAARAIWTTHGFGVA
jgi:molybdate transport system substrate-binding protein